MKATEGYYLPVGDTSVLLDGVDSHLWHTVPPAAHHLLVIADKFLVVLKDVVDGVDIAVFRRVVLRKPESAGKGEMNQHFGNCERIAIFANFACDTDR